LPARNRDYWAEKLTRNRERDRVVKEGLEAAGWTVMRFWEHETPDAAAPAIAHHLAMR